MRKFLLVLLFSPCFLCLGAGAFVWVRNTLGEHGIGTGTSVWEPLAPQIEHVHPAFFGNVAISERAAFFPQNDDSGKSSTLWRISPTGARRWSYLPGRTFSLASAEGVWFGIMSQPDPAGGENAWIYKIIRSRDEGRTWEERGVVPPMSRLLVISEQEVWCLGWEALYVSIDGGQTVRPVPLPGKRDSISERLARGLDGTVWLLGPAGLFRISDHGERWTHDPMPGVELQDGGGGVLVGRVAGTLAIRHDEPGARWIPFSFRRHRVESFAVSGNTVRVITESIDPFEEGLDVWYHQSEDGGHTWSHMETDLMFNMTLHGKEWGIGTDILGRFHGRVPNG